MNSLPSPPDRGWSVGSRRRTHYSLGCAHGGGAFFGGDSDWLGAAAPMQVGAKIVFRTLALHGCHDLATDQQSADVGATGFPDELLHQDVHIGAAKGLDNPFGRLVGFRQHHADALRALQQLDHYRHPARQFKHHFHLLGIMGKGGDRQAKANTREQLH